MDIQFVNKGNKGVFKAEDQNFIAGALTYSQAGTDKIIIDHTEIDPSYKGKGVGKKLVLAAVEYARTNSLKVLPLCPFSKSVFDKTPEIRDVLYNRV
jgi:predicted GNAT family acetyltransferase